MKTSFAATAPISSDTTLPRTLLAQSPHALSDAVNDDGWQKKPSTLRGAIARVARLIRSLGPYLAIEIILPGGSIIALALWTYRHRRAVRRGVKPVAPAIVPAVNRAPLRCVTPCAQR